MKIVVIGATGATGKKLVENLLTRDWVSEVTALVRNTNRLKPHAKLVQIKIDFEHLENYAEYIHGNVAFSCLGTTLKDAGGKKEQWRVDYDFQLKFAQLAKSNGIPTFVLLSAIGAKPNAMFFYSKMKGQLEVAVQQLDFQKLIVVKPSLLIRGEESRGNENIGVRIIDFFNNLGFLDKHQPLEVADVANAMVESIDCTTGRYKELDVGEIIKLNKL